MTFDSVHDFVLEEIVEAPGQETQAASLYGAYRIWCWKHGLIPESQKTFAMRMDALGYARRRGAIYAYVDIRLNSADTGPSHAISRQTALDIALAYDDLDRAETLLAEIGEKMREGTTPSVRDIFGRKRDGLGIAVLDGNDGSWQFFVEWTLARTIIESHIANVKDRLAGLNKIARGEINAAAPVEPNR